jgi:hypothetical protein
LVPRKWPVAFVADSDEAIAKRELTVADVIGSDIELKLM